MKNVVLLISLAIAATSASARALPAAAAFEQLRALAGSWEGTFEWSGARTGGGTLKANYQLTGNGSAVVEDLIMGDSAAPTMSTVYHMDGSDLRMTHYCAAHNQPRLKASEISQDPLTVRFSFLDATDLAGHPAHVKAFEIRILSPDSVRLQFTFGGGGGGTSIERIELRRTTPNK